MSYLDNKRNIEDAKQIKSEEKLQSYEKSFLTAELKRLDAISFQGVEFLYADLIEDEINYEFKKSLGNGIYTSANKEAIMCLDLSIKSRELIPKNIPDWTEHSQKCFDFLIVKYISDGLKEKVENNQGKVYETDIYIHLENKEDDNLKDVGLLFRLIYEKRSEFKHLHFTDENGYRRINKISNKNYVRAKNKIIDYYKEALEKFLPIYKSMFGIYTNAS